MGSRTIEVTFPNHIGSDKLLSEMTCLTRSSLTTTAFSIFTYLEGFTNLRILNIMYIAFAKPMFPYHLNIFSDIAANYSNGNLSTITTGTGSRTYTNTINYTTLANSISSSFTSFSSTLTNSKVLLYLSGVFVASVAT
jgi:hypothetical protein